MHCNLRRSRLFSSSKANLESCGSASSRAAGSSVVILCTKDKTLRHDDQQLSISRGIRKYKRCWSGAIQVMCQKPNRIERPAGKESYKSIQIIQFLTLSHPHDMLMAHDQSLSAKFAKKIQSPRRNIMLFSVGSVQSIVRFKWSSPWSSYCRIMNHTTKIHTKKRRKSCSESLQLLGGCETRS